MRELLLLRHAKAQTETPEGGSDFDRALSPRGRRQLQELRHLFERLSDAPDRILASAAVRARETAEGLRGAFPEWAAPLVIEPALYAASAEEARDLLRGLPEEILRVCVVGHNPCLSELASDLAGRDLSLPTLGAVALAVPAARWAALGAAPARVLWTARPRESL
jgi:phosphohistidine phosphatase